jgi:cell division protein ZapA
MGQVSVTFNNQEHHLGCQDGDEERLLKLANYVEEKAHLLLERMGSVGDTRLLLMTAIMIADELQDLNEGKMPKNDPASSELKHMDVALGKAVIRIEELARRIEIQS